MEHDKLPPLPEPDHPADADDATPAKVRLTDGLGARWMDALCPGCGEPASGLGSVGGWLFVCSPCGDVRWGHPQVSYGEGGAAGLLHDARIEYRKATDHEPPATDRYAYSTDSEAFYGGFASRDDARAVERAHGIKKSHNLCLSCGHSIDAHDRQYGCAEDGCDCAGGRRHGELTRKT